MRLRIFPIAAATAAGLIIIASPVAAQTGVCKVGARVVDRQDRAGVVTEANGSDCRVKLDNGESRFYLAWMLASAGRNGKAGAPGNSAAAPNSSKAASKGPTPGRYECWAAGGVAGTMRIVIRNASTYADSKGTVGEYSFDADTDKFTFDSGPWAGYFGKKLGPKQLGISSRPGNYYGTTCDLK